MQLKNVLNKKKNADTKRIKRIEMAAAAGASLAVVVVGVAALTAFYAKTLMDINYIDEDDIYND